MLNSFCYVLQVFMLPPKLRITVQRQCRQRSFPQSCPTLWDPMDCSIPGFPVHHKLPEFAQIHVHQVGDAIKPSHPLSSRSSAFNQLPLSNNLGFVPGISKDTKTYKCSIPLYKVAYCLHIIYACLPVYFKSSLMSL